MQGGDTVKALGLKKPLFKAALGASVFLPLQVEATSSWAQFIYDDLVAATNCTGGNSTFSCLESVDADTLAAAGDRLSVAQPFGFWLYVPVVDGSFLRERASVLLEQGQKNLNGVRRSSSSTFSNYADAAPTQDVFWGNNNANEGFIFVDPTLENATTTGKEARAAQFDSTLAGLFPLLTGEERQSVAQQYPSSDAPASKGNTFTRISSIIADSTFVCVLARSLLLLRAPLTLAGFLAAALLTGASRRLARRATRVDSLTGPRHMPSTSGTTWTSCGPGPSRSRRSSRSPAPLAASSDTTTRTRTRRTRRSTRRGRRTTRATRCSSPSRCR